MCWASVEAQRVAWGTQATQQQDGPGAHLLLRGGPATAFGRPEYQNIGRFAHDICEHTPLRGVCERRVGSREAYIACGGSGVHAHNP